MALKIKKSHSKKTKPNRAKHLTEVALTLFSQHDYSAVTIKDIAEKAGVNTALIYYYFSSKQDLFRATLESTIAEFLEYYETLRNRHSDPVDLINDWFDTHAEAYEPIQQLMKIMLDYSSSKTQLDVIDIAISQFYDEERLLLSNTILMGIEQGRFGKVDHKHAAEFASTYLDGVLVRKLIIKDLDIKASVEALKQVFWQHLVNEVSPENAATKTLDQSQK